LNFPSSQPSPFGEGAYVVYCEFVFLDKYKNTNITIASQSSPPLLGRVGWGEYI